VQVAQVAECYEKHSDALVRFAATLVGSADAEDVVSEAVIAVLRSVTNEVDDMRAYLYRAVVSASAKHWRSHNRRRRREKRAVVFAPTPPDWSVDVRITAALDRLSAQQRAVIHLTYWEDLTPTMAAERLGISDGSVRRQLARARKRLRECLSENR